MSKQLKTSWTCLACDVDNKCEIKKPNSLVPVITRTKCQTCGSKFMLSWRKVGGKLQVLWTVINYELTPDGQYAFDQKKSNNNQKPAAPQVETKENENAGI